MEYLIPVLAGLILLAHVIIHRKDLNRSKLNSNI